jgi:hypothetical protein
MEGHLKMSAKERQRLNLFVRVKRGELQHNEAALLCETRVSLLAYQRYQSRAIAVSFISAWATIKSAPHRQSLGGGVGTTSGKIALGQS